MSDDISKLIKQANAELQNKRLVQAEQYFREALTIDEINVDALYGLGLIRSQLGDYKEAYDTLSLAASREPEAADIAFNLAHVFSQTGQRQQALLEFQRATKYCGNDPEMCSAIAERFVSLQESTGALQILDRLTALTPNDQIVMARAYGLKGQWSESVRVLHRLSLDLPNDVFVLSELANAGANLRDYRIAIDAFERILKSRTPSSYDYLKFADLLLLAKQTKRAAQAVKIAEQNGENSVDLHITKAKLARIEGDYKLENSAVATALELAPLNGEVRMIQAELTNQADLENMASELEEVMHDGLEISKQPFHSSSLLFFAAAKLAERRGKYDQASKFLRQGNDIRLNQQQRLHSVYNADQEVKKAEKIKQDYNEKAMSKPAAVLNSNLKLQPIFIVGMPRSGAALIEKILSRINGVHALGEQEAMVFIASDYQHYQAAGQIQKPNELSSEQWQSMRQAYLDKISDLSKRIFVDKTPNNFENVGLILKLFPEAKVIQVHRNSKDVALSIYEHPFPLSHKYASRMLNTMHAISIAEDLMTHWTSLGLPQVHNLDYENLVREPDKYAKELVEFCGLSWSALILEPSVNDAGTFTFSGLQIPMSINSERIGRWKKFAKYFPEFTQ